MATTTIRSVDKTHLIWDGLDRLGDIAAAIDRLTGLAAKKKPAFDWTWAVFGVWAGAIGGMISYVAYLRGKRAGAQEAGLALNEVFKSAEAARQQ